MDVRRLRPSCVTCQSISCTISMGLFLLSHQELLNILPKLVRETKSVVSFPAPFLNSALHNLEALGVEIELFVTSAHVCDRNELSVVPGALKAHSGDHLNRECLALRRRLVIVDISLNGLRLLSGVGHICKRQEQ